MDENNLNFENTSTQEEPVAPAAPEFPVTEEKNFAVTENDSWDKHQGNIPPQPVYPNSNYIQTPPDPNAEMSVKDWFLALLVGYLPIAGLIVRIIWAAEQNPIPRNRPRKNWAIASLIWVAISYILTMLFSYLFVTVIRVIIDYFW